MSIAEAFQLSHDEQLETVHEQHMQWVRSTGIVFNAHFQRTPSERTSSKHVLQGKHWRIRSAAFAD